MGTENYLPWGRVGKQARGVPEAKREKFQGGRGSVMSYAVERWNVVGTEECLLDSAMVTILDISVPAEQGGQKPVGSEWGRGLLESQEDPLTSPEFSHCMISCAWITFFLCLPLHGVMPITMLDKFPSLASPQVPPVSPL